MKRGRSSTAVPPSTKSLVLARDQGLCVIAGPFCVGVASIPDHRANRGAGGSSLLNDPSNLIAACTLCNGWKEDVTGDEREELVRRGVRVIPNSTHAKTLERARETSVIYPDGSRFLLHADGSRVPA
ncbi:HNH endonuclease [Pseudoclavibacter helvolus]